MFGRFQVGARARRLGVSTLSIALVAAAAAVGSSVIVPASAGADCAAPPVSTLSLVAVDGQPPSPRHSLAKSVPVAVSGGDTLTYRLSAASGCHTNTPFTLDLAVPTPPGTTYSGQGEGWVFGAHTASGTGTQSVTVPGRASIAKQFTVRVDANGGQNVITATATTGAGGCDCTVTTPVTGPDFAAGPVASPTNPSATITLVDNVAGRAVPADQFTLQLRDPAATGTAALGALVTAHTQTSASTKPITVVAGRPYEISAAIGADSPSQLADYTASLTCTDAAGVAVATTGVAPTWTVSADAQASVTCTVNEVPAPLDCTSGNTLFGLSAARSGTQIVTSDSAGKLTSIGPVYPKQASGLGLTADGSRAYLVDGDGTVVVYSTATGAFTELLDSGVTGVTVGAVDPANGDYYFGTADALYEYHATENTVDQIGGFGSAPTGLAFGRNGNGYLITGAALSSFSVPTAGGSDALTLSQLISGLPASRGLAFGADGNLNLATSDGVQRFDPTTGAFVDAPVAGALIDVTGCASPYLLAVATTQPRGMFTATDRFSATLSGGAIAGTSTGPLLATPDSSYAVAETMPSGDPATYAISWSCLDSVSRSTIASGAGASGAFRLGRTLAGGDLTCVFVNTALTPAMLQTTTNLISVNGGAVPAAGVASGDVLTYQVSVHNSGQLAGSTTVHEQVPFGTDYSGTGEGWSVAGGGADLGLAVDPGATVTATFTVTVGRLPADTRTIDERAATSFGDCVGCSISTPTAAVLATTLALIAVNGSPVGPGQTVGPGDVLQYRVVLTNSGGTSGSTIVTEPVPANTNYTGPTAEGWSIGGTSATRSLTASAGGSASTTFTVTVDNPLQIGTTEVTNSASASSGSCACTVTVAVPAYAAAITASTSRAHLGDTVTYTVLVRNNGSVDYTADHPAVVSDDLSGLLDDARYNDDASRSGVLSGSVITWRLALPSGTLIALTFTVTINAPDTGDKRLLDSIATPAGMGGNCPPGSKVPDCVANTVGLLTYSTTLTASTAIAHPGDVVTYTVTVANTGSLAYTDAEPARFSLDLAEANDDAAYRNDATGAAVLTGSTLSWALAVPAGRSIAVTFSVLISRPDTGDDRLPIAVQSPAGQGGFCVPGSPATACEPVTVLVAAFSTTMVASAGVVRPGQKVTYTVLALNTGGVDYPTSDPAIVAVDVSGLLDDASYDGDANNGAAYSRSNISWSVALPIGVTRSFTFSMTVRAAGAGDGNLLGRLVTSPGGNCPPGSPGLECATAPAALQAYTTAISADRPAATNGDTIAYRVTVKNAGTVAYSATEPARFANDLHGVLDDADFNGALTSPASFSGTTINWKSALPVGATMTLTYSITVASPDSGDGILVAAVTTPADLGGNCGPTGASTDCASKVVISSLSLVTRSAPVTMRDPGDVISYVFTVTNTGHLPVGGVHLVPVNFTGTSAAPNLAGCALRFGDLAVGATRTCELTYSVSAADIDAGVITVSAVAQGTDQHNPLVASNQSTGLVTLVAPITLSMRAITTDVNGDGVIDAGDRVDWTISATDTGTSALTGLSVSDSLLGPATCSQTTLQRDAVTDCIVATYTIRDSDANAALVDSAIATGMQVNGAEIDALQASYVLQVMSPPPVRSNVRTSATARLALIVFVTLLALGGLFLLAGWRSRSRVHG